MVQEWVEMTRDREDVVLVVDPQVVKNKSCRSWVSLDCVGQVKVLDVDKYVRNHAQSPHSRS